MFGEAAVVAVVEAIDHAEARGATIIAELAGGALTADAFHISAPEPSGTGATLAMQRAVRDAHLEPEQVPGDHGPRHLDAPQRRHRDDARSAAPSATTPIAWRSRATRAWSATRSGRPVRSPRSPPCSPSATGILPPTINQETPDPDCDLDYVPNVARRGDLDVVLVNGFGFGGQNAVAAFTRPA